MKQFKNLFSIIIMENQIKQTIKSKYFAFSKWQQNHFRIKVTGIYLLQKIKQIKQLIKNINKNKYINMIQTITKTTKNIGREIVKPVSPAIKFICGLIVLSAFFTASGNTLSAGGFSPRSIDGVKAQEAIETIQTVELAPTEPCQNMELAEEVACLAELIKQ
jgi:hypothetical protein